MNPYPGVAVPTVHSSGGGSPGVLISLGPTDPHGWFPTGNEATGNDTRNASTAMALGEGNADRTNWCAWRTIDWIAGGNYTAWDASVSLSTHLSLFQQLTVNVSGAPGGQVALQLVGQSGENAASVQSVNADAVLAQVLSGNGRAFVGIGNGGGAGGDFSGGSANGHGAVCTAGASGGSGVKAVAAGGVAVWSAGGPIYVDTATTGSTQTGTVSQTFANNVIQATDTISLNATGSPAARGTGVNIGGVALSVSGGGGHFLAVTVTFATPLTNSNYDVFCTPFVDAGTGDIYLPYAEYGGGRLNTGFNVKLFTALADNTIANVDTLSGAFSLLVTGGVS